MYFMKVIIKSYRCTIASSTCLPRGWWWPSQLQNWRFCSSYAGVRPRTPEMLRSMRGNLIGFVHPIFVRGKRCGDDLAVLFCCLVQCALARSKETRDRWYGVRGPLPTIWGEEFVRKTTFFAGQVLFRVVISAVSRSAKSQQQKTREFDGTLGFPGEDISLAFPVGN